MKIFLDDIRECPKGYVLCRTAEEAIELFTSEDIECISFDHDLGTELTGYDVALFIEESIAEGSLNKVPLWRIHSSNPVGGKRIQAAMQSAERLLRLVVGRAE